VNGHSRFRGEASVSVAPPQTLAMDDTQPSDVTLGGVSLLL
jgi:hypothetical protein